MQTTEPMEKQERETVTYHGCLTRAFRRVRSCTAEDSSAHGVRGAHIQDSGERATARWSTEAVCATGTAHVATSGSPRV